MPAEEPSIGAESRSLPADCGDTMESLSAARERAAPAPAIAEYVSVPWAAEEPSAQEVLYANKKKWRCLGSVSVLFGPPNEKKDVREAREAEAKRLCGSCPVKGPCLEVALSFPGRQQHGVQGGMTAEERKAILKDRAHKPQ